MSIHSSLRSGKGGLASLRNVLKRYERIRHLMEREEWPEGRSVFGLPKIKQARIKARKGPAKEEAEASPTEQPTAEPSASA